MHKDDITLETEIKKFTRVTKVQELALKKLKLNTLRDVLFYFPSRYEDPGMYKNIQNLGNQERVIVRGVITEIKKEVSFKSRIPMTKATLIDTTGKIDIMWLYQPYLANMIKPDEEVTLSGVVNLKNSKKVLINPEILHTKINTGESLFQNIKQDIQEIPVYPETRGLNSKWFFHVIQKILEKNLHKTLEDLLPAKVREEYHLPDVTTAIVWIHFPRKKLHTEAARKRFAFEEIFMIEIERLLARAEYRKNEAYTVIDHSAEFFKTLPFTLTKSQKSVFKDIMDDVKNDYPMTRLLEGDVGSGKTVIAAGIAHSAVMSTNPKKKNEHLQVLYMAPTEILANQHFESFCEMFFPFNKTIGLITSSGCKKFPAKSISMKRSDILWTNTSRTQLLKWAKDGTIDILIGTQSLMSKSIVMRNFALAIIDEQHRFGAKQRHSLISKEGFAPHLLSMTATPIPRTLALTIFGDLDLSLLTDMPPGRKPIITKFIQKAERESMYNAVLDELKNKRQAYVICPKIDEGDDSNNVMGSKKSVKEEAKRLAKNEFKNYRVGVLHGKLKTSEKEEIMEKFLRHEIDVLVATSVIEVGVNVPNASIIIIEDADRFGMAQLHQLRGRVIRGNHQSYCYLLSSTANDKSLTRMINLVESQNGFELSEKDMLLRGPGHFAGVKQSGVSDIAMEALKNIRLVEIAKKEAKELLSKDKDLTKNKGIENYLKTRLNKTIHFE